jgi:hypothetical protein
VRVAGLLPKELLFVYLLVEGAYTQLLFMPLPRQGGGPTDGSRFPPHWVPEQQARHPREGHGILQKG